MAATAFQTQYRDEFINGFELRQSKVRDTVTTEAMVKGNQAIFLIAKSGREAVTRGSNGLIPASADDLTQVTATLKEKHDLSEKTGFNVFAGQSDQRRIMQEQSMGVINRDIDVEIITALATGTVTTGSAATFSKTLVNKALTKLFNGEVENDGQIFGLITPAAWALMTDIPAASSADYTKNRPMDAGPVIFNWLNVNWRMHTRLPGIGTNSATCLLYHKSAIGHAVNKSDIDAKAGYDEKQDTSWARTSLYHGAKLLQNGGVVKIIHDDSTLS